MPQRGAVKETSMCFSPCSHGRLPPCSWGMQGSLGTADSPGLLVVSRKAESAKRFGGTFRYRTASKVLTIFIYGLGEVKDNLNTACAYVLEGSVSKWH